MRLINLLPSVNLEGEVLDADVVVAVSATVGWTQAETTVTDCSWSRKVDDFLRTSVGRIPDLFDPPERAEQVEIEGEGPLNVGDGQIEVMDSSRWHRAAQSMRARGRAARAMAVASLVLSWPGW